jgi:CDGSH iron-sulfur domain-containing protein 3
MGPVHESGLPKVAACEPVCINVVPGKIYSWCSCGLSQKQPFCDSSHKTVEGMPLRSLKVQFEAEEQVWFCMCKHTSTPPFCDGTHRIVEGKITL